MNTTTGAGSTRPMFTTTETRLRTRNAPISGPVRKYHAPRRTDGCAATTPTATRKIGMSMKLAARGNTGSTSVKKRIVTRRTMAARTRLRLSRPFAVCTPVASRAGGRRDGRLGPGGECTERCARGFGHARDERGRVAPARLDGVHREEGRAETIRECSLTQPCGTARAGKARAHTSVDIGGAGCHPLARSTRNGRRKPASIADAACARVHRALIVAAAA